MTAAQRNKGAAGERELFKLLAADLGQVVQRNLAQSRAGGADCISIPGFAIEVKRQEQLRLNAWWEQTVEQAGEDIPILFYRASRQPWRAVLDLHRLAPDIYPAPLISTCVTDYGAAVQFIREHLH